jgi:hypothetical protein
MTSSSNDERETMRKLVEDFKFAWLAADAAGMEGFRVEYALSAILPAHDERVKAEAAHDALMAEADAIENYTLMWMPGGGVRLDHILGLLRRDAGIRRES